MKKRKRRNYTQEFRDEAVKLITQQGYSYAEAGRNFGVNPNLLSKWKRGIEGSSGNNLSPGNAAAIQSELKRPGKENKRLRMEREILKKAYPISLLCTTMQVSRSGYYSWKHRGKSKRKMKGLFLIVLSIIT